MRKNPAVIAKHQAFDAHANRLCSESEQRVRLIQFSILIIYVIFASVKIFF